MARDIFLDVVGMTDTSGNYKPLSDIQVTVYLAGTTTNATIYTGRTGATVKANPFTTLAGGMVEFWAEYGGFDIKFHDLGTPVRITDKTFGWNSTNAEPGGVPSNRIAGDAGLPFAAQDALSKYQHVPIGGIIDWWRPDASIPTPYGWAICDGGPVPPPAHDFGTGTTINLPDLRNAFILGASIGKTDGTAGTLGNGTGDAPGIRGVGGSNTHLLTAAQSGIAEHSHNMEAVALGGNPPTMVAGTESKIYVRGSTTGGGSNRALPPPTTTGAFDYGIGVGGLHGSPQPASAAHSSTPRYVGLLKIMKIKRT